MRKLIAGMKISVDGKTEGPEGYADWVEAWSDDYGVMSRIDACLLGEGMYPRPIYAEALAMENDVASGLFDRSSLKD